MYAFIYHAQDFLVYYSTSKTFCVYYTIKSAKVHTILNYFLLQYALCCMQQVFYLLILIIYEKYGILISYFRKICFCGVLRQRRTKKQT